LFLLFNYIICDLHFVFQTDEWMPIPGLSVRFSLAKEWRLHLLYSIQVRPQGAQNLDPLLARDFVGSRLLIDGVAYRETGSLFHTITRTYKSGILAGALSLLLSKGPHTIQVEWRKWGENVPNWFSVPNIHGGFVSGRSLVVTGEFLGPTGQPALLTLQGPSVVDGWHDVAGLSQVLDLQQSSLVEVKFLLHVTNLGKPDVDSWTWTRWRSLQMRLLVDGLPLVNSGAKLDAHVRIVEHAFGVVNLNLPTGSHSIKLQWKQTAHNATDDRMSWRTVQVSELLHCYLHCCVCGVFAIAKRSHTLARFARLSAMYDS
jgi:hypothetical protein